MFLWYFLYSLSQFTSKVYPQEGLLQELRVAGPHVPGIIETSRPQCQLGRLLWRTIATYNSLQASLKLYVVVPVIALERFVDVVQPIISNDAHGLLCPGARCGKSAEKKQNKDESTLRPLGSCDPLDHGSKQCASTGGPKQCTS